MSTKMCIENIKENKLKHAEWLNKQVITEIKLSKVILDNPIHRFAKIDLTDEIRRLKENDNTKIINPIVVKYNSQKNRYELISGLKAYHLARALHQDYIPTVIVDYDRTEYCRQVGITDVLKFGWRNIDSIIIPLRFIESGVSDYKVENCIEYYKKHGYMDKSVVLRDRVCKDGYARLVASQHIGMDKVWVQYI